MIFILFKTIVISVILYKMPLILAPHTIMGLKPQTQIPGDGEEGVVILSDRSGEGRVVLLSRVIR